MQTAVFTIISPNYRHFARVLMASLQRHHPEWDRFVLVTGATDVLPVEASFTSVPLEALPLPNPRQFCFRYSILELNTAVKPWMFEHLFARGYDRVVFIDPDIVVYSPLAELDAAPAETFLRLTPHMVSPSDRDEESFERRRLLFGVYNLGFLEVSRRPALARFLRWWQDKLELQCIDEPANGIFVDQKWMDLVPGLFPEVSILRHDGYNVAYWNLRQRHVVAAGEGFTVNGVPLRFFHFSGYRTAMPDHLSRGSTLELSEIGAARKLFEDYLVAIREAGRASFEAAPYAYGAFADGTPVPNAVRIAYRNSSSLQAAAGPDPFAHPELFTAIRMKAKAGMVSWRVLSSARPIVRLLPPRFRTSMRQLLLGR